MRGPRIILGRPPVAPDLLLKRWIVRYGVAVAAIALPAVIVLLARPGIGRDLYLLLLFASVLLVSVVAGLGPGLLATGLATLLAYYLPPGDLSVADQRLLVVEGLLVSFVGGTLRTARLKASERLDANLKLEQQILEIGDDERRRIGHDLHDGLGQHLTGISLLSETMSQQLAAGRAPDPGDVETITRLMSEAVGITRDLAKSLSPVTLERDGFIAAMEELADTSSALFGIDCRWEFDGQPTPLDRTRALHLYRIVQEAVNNSVRHGKARHVLITLTRSGNGEFSICVSDDGSGLSEKTMNNPGLGLRIMQYRARMLGAVLAVERASPKGGTIVTCACPIDGRSGGS